MAGEIPLSSLQAGVEVTPGTAVAATAVVPILQGWMREQVERNFPEEMRASFIAHYRNFALKNYVELGGIQIAPTFEGLGSWLNLFLKGFGQTGATVDTTGKAYTYKPTVASDDLKTATFECADPTQNFQVPYVIGNRLEATFGRNQPLLVSMDLLGQKAVAQAKTGSLTAGAYEDIDGAVATATIDTTTIGSTAVTNVLDAKYTIDNGFIQDFVLDGNLFPRSHHRSKARYMQLEATLQFINMTEYTIFQNSGIGTPRKIRITANGTNIAGSGGPTKRSLVSDWYGVWETAEFDSVDGQRVVKVTGRSQYDATATYDWQWVLTHALSPLVW